MNLDTRVYNELDQPTSAFSVGKEIDEPMRSGRPGIKIGCDFIQRNISRRNAISLSESEPIFLDALLRFALSRVR